MYERALSTWVAAKEKCTVIVPVMNDLAKLYMSEGKLAEAEQMYATTIPMIQKELGDEEADWVADQRIRLARVYMAENKFAEAEPELREGIEVLQKLHAVKPDELLPALYSYRIVLETLKRADELRRVQAQIDAINGWQADSAEPRAKWQGLMSMVYQATSIEQHMALLKQALVEAEKLGPGQELLKTLTELGMVSQGAHKDDAERYLKRALTVSESAFGMDSRETANALEVLAGFYEAQQKFSQAEPLRKQYIAVWEKIGGPPMFLALAYSHIGDFYYHQQKFTEAEAPYLRALTVDEGRTDSKDSSLSLDMQRLGKLYLDWGRYLQAVQYYQQELEVEE